MTPHKGKRLFITGIPTAGKSHLAKKLAAEVDGIIVLLDDFRETLASRERYKPWVNFYLDQDEETYLTKTTPDDMWKNLVAQSEALWSAFLEKINSYASEQKPVIFECVNILPHLAHQDIEFPGIVLIGDTYEKILERNRMAPRWSAKAHLQELEAKTFFHIERPHYKAEAEKYGYPIFKNSDDAFPVALKLLSGL